MVTRRRLCSASAQASSGLLDSGLSNQEIADRLRLTVGTVKWHLHNLLMKLRVRNRSAAIFKAKRVGLLKH